MYDIFVSHASEDKDEMARPLAERLRASGLNVWYDEFSLRLGDSLRESIDKGLASSRYGLVILSHSFFAKKWPQAELNGLFAMETAVGDKKIIPIWHDIIQVEVAQYSPILADRIAVSTTQGLDRVIEQLLDTIDPGWHHKAGMGRVVAISPSSIRLHSGEWAVKTAVTISNRSDVPAYTVTVRLNILGEGISSSSVAIDADSQDFPIEETIGDIIVSADQLRLNCSTKDGKQIVLFIIHTLHAKSKLSLHIKGTAPVSSSAEISVADIDETPRELLTRAGQEFSIMFKPTEDLIINGVSIKMRPRT